MSVILRRPRASPVHNAVGLAGKLQPMVYAPSHTQSGYIYKDLKNIKNVKGCRDGMPKSMQTR